MDVKRTLMEQLLRMVGTRIERPPAPPAEAYRVLPWGAIDWMAHRPNEDAPEPPAASSQQILDDASRTADG